MKRINYILITAMALAMVAMFANADIPPAPVGLNNDTGNYWVNYTWSKDLGCPDNDNVTDSFNVSMNGTWYNGTATFLNKSVGPGGWANITVWAYNATGNGNMSVDDVSDNVQAPGAATELPRKCGYIPPLMDLSHLGGIPVKGIQAPGDLPGSFDWRDSGNVTPVKDQSTCGTCWIFGTTSVLESAVLINEGAECNFSEQSVALCVDRSWTYLYDHSTDPCDAGGWGWLAAEAFIKKGSVLESCNPYNTTALNCDGSCVCDDCASVKKVDGYRLATDNGSEIDVIKNAVYAHGPVTMSFNYTNTSECMNKYDDPTWGTIYDYYPCSEDANHLVSIIGWNDSVPHPDADHGGTGAWIVKNSWGTDWGDGGYFYLAYNSSSVTEIAYLEYKDPVPDEELLYWDEAGFVGSVGYGDSGAWMASNFTADQSGNLTHVDFWTTSNNAEYEIYVGDGYFGIELANQTGTCQELGYYSIPLNTPIPMAAGQQFTVGVNMTTPGYNYPIPVEYEITGTVSPTIQSNVSFIRHNTSDSWTDMADLEWDKNACLRARMVATFNCACGDICVNETGWWRDDSVFNANNTAPIQAAVDGATAGETICVAAGSYEENVNLGTSHLTLAGEGADVVNVTAPAPDGDHVFSVTADYVNISGFNVAGASSGKAGIYLDSADHCNISDNNVSDNGWDIYIMSSESTFTDNTLNGTTVSFIYSGDVSLKGVGSPAADPSGQNTIDKFINATNQSAGAWLYLNFSYSDSDVSGLDESSLAVWKHNGTDWLADGWNGTRYLDATNNLVGANITTFSVFAPMASAAAAGAPNITSYAPDTPVSNNEGVAKTFNVTANQTVNATWYINGSEAQQNTTASTEVAYTNTSAVAGYWNVSVVVNNTNGTDMQTWWWTVNAVHPEPNITSWSNDKTNNNSTAITVNESVSVRFNATANQPITTWNWHNNGTLVQSNNFDNYTTSWSVNGTNTISVNATNANGTSSTTTWTVTVNDITPPAQVLNLTNDTTTATTVNLSWNANTEADLAGYKVCRNGTLLGSTVNAYHNVTGLSPSTTYEFNVSAYDDNDLEGENASVTVTTAAIVHPVPAITSWSNDKTNNDSTTLTVNESVSVRFNATANQPITTWNWHNNTADQSNNFDNYTTSWSVNGTNTISVNATNANGTSNTVTWTVIVTDITPPAQVLNLTNDTTTATTVDLSWTANTESDLAGYKVYRNGTLLGSTVNAYHNVTGLSPSTTYKFNVSAYDDNDLEGENASVTVTTAAVVHPAPAITSWDNNKTNNDSTTLTVNESVSVRFNATANQPITTWNWHNNTADQSNNFDNYTTSWSVNGTNTISVNATNANGTSNTVAWTVTVTDIRPPAQVMNLANDTTTTTTVDLSWNANTEADLAGYRVYQNGALIDSPHKSRTYYNVTGLSSSTAYEFNVSAYDDNGLEGANASRTVTTAVGPLHHISVTPDSKTLNISESWNFTATGRDQNNGKISGLVFAWARSDTCIGSLNNSTGTVVNFTAGRVGITYITASNGRVTSDPVQVTVNAGTSNTTFANKTTFRAKSGDANATGNFKNNVSGWISATARGNATNSSEVNQSHPRSGLGSGDKVMGGVIVNVSGNITEELAAGNGTIRIQICYNATTLTALGIDASTLAIWKYNSTTEKWMQQSSTTTSEGCAHVDVNHLCTFALVGSKAIGSSTSGSGTYPPGWFGTPTATVTATKAPAASATTTDASHSDKVAPAPTKKPAASTATTPAAEGTTAKKGAPGFTAIFAIAGLLAIAYVLMRRRG